MSFCRSKETYRKKGMRSEKQRDRRERKRERNSHHFIREKNQRRGAKQRDRKIVQPLFTGESMN